MDGIACVWSSSQEWDGVFELLYSSNLCGKRNGLARVAAWRARGSVPALVEVTADLVSCIVHEHHCTRSPGLFSEHVLQLMYATALTRFVNGVYDVHFVTSAAPEKDIKTVLARFGVPPYIVALRHECAHKTLPSLECLKFAADFGLKWLLHNYWEPQSLLNQQVERTKMTEGSVQFNTVGRQTDNGKKRQKSQRMKALLSRCSKRELTKHLLHGELFNPEYKISLPKELSVLPKLYIDSNIWSQWIGAIRKVSEKQTGVETLVLCSCITVIHHPNCNEERKHFLAGCIGLFLEDSSREPRFPTECVSWQDLYSTLIDNPGQYSEAILKIVLPYVKTSGPIHADHLTPLITKSERLSLYAYWRQRTNSIISQRLQSESMDENDKCLSRKRLRLGQRDSSSKWAVVTEFDNLPFQMDDVHLELVDEGEESMDCLGTSSPSNAGNPDDGSETVSVRTPLSKKEIDCIKTKIHKHFFR